MTNTDDKQPPPRVFISYSHDDKDHKAWVTKLATRLREKGVDVILDQWDTEPGDDLAKFMEAGVRDADRVLMICTEKYVRKVDDGKGGAGYEAMIVSSELISDQGVRKFVPLIRQTSAKRVVPTALGTRKYIDLSEGVENADEQFAELLESIHKVIAKKKPPLGPNPFSGSGGSRESAGPGDVLSGTSPDPSENYNRAVEIVRSQDRMSWRRMLAGAVSDGGERLLAWKKERQMDCPATLEERKPEPWLEFFGEGIACYDPLLASLLAAAESGEPEFSGQRGWIDLVLEPKGWERSGSTVWTELPRAVLFTLHSYLGGMLMRSGGGDEAVKLATTPIPDSFRRSEMKPLFLTTNVSGWIETFGGNCVVSWAYFNFAGDNREWLINAFGAEESIKVGRVAYFMLLSFLEFVKDAAKEKWTFDPKQSRLEVSHMFVRTPEATQHAAFGLLLENQATLTRVLESNGVDHAKFAKLWPEWTSGMKSWATHLGDGYRHHPTRFPLDGLPREIYRNPFDLRSD